MNFRLQVLDRPGGFQYAIGEQVEGQGKMFTGSPGISAVNQVGCEARKIAANGGAAEKGDVRCDHCSVRR